MHLNNLSTGKPFKDGGVFAGSMIFTSCTMFSPAARQRPIFGWGVRGNSWRGEQSVAWSSYPPLPLVPCAVKNVGQRFELKNLNVLSWRVRGAISFAP